MGYIKLTSMAQNHYIGVDVGTGSARACIIDSTGEIKALASENIKLWQPAHGYGGSHYVCKPTFFPLHSTSMESARRLIRS